MISWWSLINCPWERKCNSESACSIACVYLWHFVEKLAKMSISQKLHWVLYLFLLLRFIVPQMSSMGLQVELAIITFCFVLFLPGSTEMLSFSRLPLLLKVKYYWVACEFNFTYISCSVFSWWKTQSHTIGKVSEKKAVYKTGRRSEICAKEKNIYIQRKIKTWKDLSICRGYSWVTWLWTISFSL